MQVRSSKCLAHNTSVGSGMITCWGLTKLCCAMGISGGVLISVGAEVVSTVHPHCNSKYFDFTKISHEINEFIPASKYLAFNQICTQKRLFTKILNIKMII